MIPFFWSLGFFFTDLKLSDFFWKVEILHNFELSFLNIGEKELILTFVFFAVSFNSWAIKIICSFLIKEEFISVTFAFISSNLRPLFFSSEILFGKSFDSNLYFFAFLKDSVTFWTDGMNIKIVIIEALKIPIVGFKYWELRISYNNLL